MDLRKWGDSHRHHTRTLAHTAVRTISQSRTGRNSQHKKKARLQSRKNRQNHANRIKPKLREFNAKSRKPRQKYAQSRKTRRITQFNAHHPSCKFAQSMQARTESTSTHVTSAAKSRKSMHALQAIQCTSHSLLITRSMQARTGSTLTSGRIRKQARTLEPRLQKRQHTLSLQCSGRKGKRDLGRERHPDFQIYSNVRAL